MANKDYYCAILPGTVLFWVAECHFSSS